MGKPTSGMGLDGHNQLPKIIRGVKFADGCKVIAMPDDLQTQTILQAITKNRQ
jgi:hypothetical protein